MGQDIASACGQLVLKKQDNNKTNHATNNSTSNNNSNDKKSSYNTSIEIEDFISKQKAKLTHATYNNNTTTTNTNNNTATNGKSGNKNTTNQIYQRNKPPPYPLKRKKTGSADLTLSNPSTSTGSGLYVTDVTAVEKDDGESGDRNQVPAHSTTATTATATNKATTAIASTSTSDVSNSVKATGVSNKSSMICGVVLTAMYLCAYIMTTGNR